METPESTVYRGVEGSGAAQIFGRPGNPMQAYLYRKNDIARREAIQYERDKLLKQQRDKKTWDILNVEPEAAWEPFNQQVISASNVVRKQTADELAARPWLVEDQNWIAANKKRWDDVNAIARRSQYIKKEIDATRQTIKDAPYLEPEYYHTKINDLYMNPDGTAKNLNDVDVNKIRNIYIDDPRGFNTVKYEQDYKKGLNDNMSNYITQRQANNGILTEDHETKWKGRVYTADPSSPYGVKVDANGEPVINDVPELYDGFLNSDFARRAYSAMAADKGVPVNDFVRPRIVSASSLTQQVKPQFSRNPATPQWQYNLQHGGGLSNDEQNMSRRVFDYIGNITNAFYDEDGNRRTDANPNAREALGHLRGKKLGAGVVQDATLVPGTNKPGKGNSPNDRLILKMRASNGKTSTQEIDLADEGSAAELWNGFNQGGYFGKKQIPFDAAVDQLGIDPQSFWKGKENLGVNQEKEQAVINDLTEGNGFEALQGKTYNGQQIKSITPKKERSFFAPINGDFVGYDVELANGQKKFIKADDTDALQNILRSTTKVQTAGKKKTGVTWD